MSCNDPFLKEMLDDLEAQIKAAMMAQTDSDGITSYTFNTGQTVQTVSRSSQAEMEAYINGLLAKRDNLRIRLGLDRAGFQAVPEY